MIRESTYLRAQGELVEQQVHKYFSFDGLHRFLPALFKGYGKNTYFINVDHRPRVYGYSKYGTLDRLFIGIKDLIKVAKIIKEFRSNRD